jgi:hypothetical protein
MKHERSEGTELLMGRCILSHLQISGRSIRQRVRSLPASHAIPVHHSLDDVKPGASTHHHWKSRNVPLTQAQIGKENVLA